MDWNIHGAASVGWNNGYTIKKFIVDRIIAEKSDIVIINEFIISKGWDYFQEKLIEFGYIWFMTNTSTDNGVLIAVKKESLDMDLVNEVLYKSEMVTTKMMTTQSDKPNFLQVKLNINNKELYVIGTRIRVLIDKNATEEQISTFKINQLQALKEHMDKVPSSVAIVCGGDFNVWQSTIKKELGTNYSVSTPRYSMSVWQDYSTLDTWSAVPYCNGNKQLFDHYISRGIKELKNVNYDGWSFVNTSANEYQNRSKADYKSDLIGCPDHDILTADIEL